MSFENRKENIALWIEDKLNWIGIKELGLTRFFVCGGALRPNEPINDFDLYPINDVAFSHIRDRLALLKKYPFGRTVNADSYFINGYLVQLSKYMGNTIEEIVKDFDFAHTKFGVRVRLVDGRYKVVKCYFSAEYKDYVISGKNKYTKGQAHPLDSLIRAFKYAKRGLLQPQDVVYDILDEFRARYGYSINEGLPMEYIGEEDKKLMPT